jgi:hypothetical protein
MSPIEISEVVKNYAQVAAWASGAGYFAIKFIQGYRVIDMSLEVSPTRQHSGEPEVDYLTASVKLTKGDRASFRMHEAVVIVRQGNDQQKIDLPIQRFSRQKVNGLFRVNFDRVSSRVPTLNLAPGETACMSTWVKVDRNLPCVVEAVVIGTGFGSLTVGQWRASAVSLPLVQ